MVAPISSLANMEMALYGGFGMNANAPSYANGYMGGNNYSNNITPSFYGYGSGYNNYGGYNNSTFGQSIPYGYGATTPQQAQESVFQGLSSTDTQALIDDYKKSLTPSEGIIGATVGGAAFGVMMHPRLIAHPWNSAKITPEIEKMFSAVKKEGHHLNKLWTNPETNGVMREAYFQMHKAAARKGSKLGLFRRSYSAKGNEKLLADVNKAMKEMEALLKNPKASIDDIARVTADLKNCYKSDGIISRGFNKIAEPIKNFFGMKSEAVTAKSILQDNAKLSYKGALKKGGTFGFLLFAGIELAMGISKIKTAFEKDDKTGMKQLGQTTVKALGNAGGWALGEAAGIWASAAIGAKIGTLFGPGVGTAIGGLLGIVGGTVGMWLTGKATHALVGQDVADDIEAKKLAQSQEGQVQLLQNTMQRMQSGEKVSAQAQQAVQKLMTQYA